MVYVEMCQHWLVFVFCRWLCSKLEICCQYFNICKHWFHQPWVVLLNCRYKTWMRHVAASLPCVNSFYPSQVSEELSVSLTVSTSINQSCAISKHFRDPVFCTFTSGELWTPVQRLSHVFLQRKSTWSRALQKSTWSNNPVASRYYLNPFPLLPTKILNLCSAFKTPTLSSSRCTTGLSELCSGEEFILTSFSIKSASKCFQLKPSFLPLYLPRWDQKSSKSPTGPLSFCHIQQSMEVI